MDADQAILEIGKLQSVSRETSDKLRLFAELLEKWNRKINLVSPASLPDLWQRHIFDAAQLMPMIPEAAKTLLDIGTGGGFPGLIIALMADEGLPDLAVTMIESDQRKCAFLQTVSGQLGLKTRVMAERVEVVPAQGADVMTSRALASLDRLLAHADMHLAEGGQALFLKGANAEAEVNEALASWAFELQKIPSKTNAEAVILKISNLRHR